MVQLYCHLCLWFNLSAKNINCRLAVNTRKHWYLACKIIPVFPEKWHYSNTRFCQGLCLAWFNRSENALPDGNSLDAFTGGGGNAWCQRASGCWLFNFSFWFPLFVYMQCFVYMRSLLHRALSWCPHRNRVEQFSCCISYLLSPFRMLSQASWKLPFVEGLCHSLSTHLPSVYYSMP